MIVGASPFPQPVASPYAVNYYGRDNIQINQPTEGPSPIEATLPRFVNYLADYSGCGHRRRYVSIYYCHGS